MHGKRCGMLSATVEKNHPQFSLFQKNRTATTETSDRIDMGSKGGEISWMVFRQDKTRTCFLSSQGGSLGPFLSDLSQLS